MISVLIVSDQDLIQCVFNQFCQRKRCIGVLQNNIMNQKEPINDF